MTTASSYHPLCQRKSSLMSSSSGPDFAKIPHILPHKRVFPIQVGSELFKLSGASISSDAPSYFSEYFRCQLKQAEDTGEDLSTAIRTLYIDRDPVTFKDISLHLQGYHVQPRDGTHFVRLFADAQFYSLPRLISQLYEESIFMSIGHKEFQIPRDLFNAPGNSPNYFSLGFAIFFSSPDDLFPGLDREGLIRPPSILPPSVPGRSAEVFDELLHLLRGYPVEIRSEAHRAALLRDARYFNFKGIEQRLIPHSLSFNQVRGCHEIVLRLEDILKSGISVVPNGNHDDDGVDDSARDAASSFRLVVEIAGENTAIDLPRRRACFFRDASARVSRLLQVLSAKLSALGATVAERDEGDDGVPVALEPDASVVLDGRPWSAAPPRTRTLTSGAHDEDEYQVLLYGDEAAPTAAAAVTAGDDLLLPYRKRRRMDADEGAPAAAGGGDSGEEGESWIVRTGQWRLRLQSAGDGQSGVICVFVPVKLDAMTSERARNAARPFLSQ
ncbi:hypothetical protein VTK73DRAFT_1854 [Phialemonium thermophilum]|uniref:Potassium channel tetramerisation-type BTB domain-containing protein n=1 Tax=Phialemonium thermophilum TaxID=223376 RepID=A0ABR3VSY7_9PEZI